MHHRTRCSALGALALLFTLSGSPALLSGPEPQSGRAGQDDPAEPPPEDRDLYPWSRIGARKDDVLLERLQGAWQLVRMQSPESDPARRSQVGILLVSGHYLSLELHVGWQQAGISRRPPLGILQAGTHRFRLGPGARIQLTSLIGTTMDARGNPKAEAPGTQRLFDVEVLDNRLVLDRLDGYKLTFTRLQEDRRERDFYGRPIRKETAEEEADEGELQK